MGSPFSPIIVNLYMYMEHFEQKSPWVCPPQAKSLVQICGQHNCCLATPSTSLLFELPLWYQYPSVNLVYHGRGRWEANLLPGCDGEEIREEAKHHGTPNGNTHRLVPPLSLPPPPQNTLWHVQEPQTMSSQCLWTGKTREPGLDLPNKRLPKGIKSFSLF